jgi:hypothetical protein
MSVSGLWRLAIRSLQKTSGPRCAAEGSLSEIKLRKRARPSMASLDHVMFISSMVWGLVALAGCHAFHVVCQNVKRHFNSDNGSASDATGVKKSKEPCARTIAFACATLACTLNVSIFLTCRKSALIALTEFRDKFTSMRHPPRTCISSELYEPSVRHHIVWKGTLWVTRVVNKGWLPVVVGTQAHVSTPPFRSHSPIHAKSQTRIDVNTINVRFNAAAHVTGRHVNCVQNRMEVRLRRLGTIWMNRTLWWSAS